MENSQKLIKSGALIKATFQDYKRHVLKFIELIAYSLVGSLPFMILLFVGAALILEKRDLNYLVLGGMIVLLLATFVLALIFSLKAQVGSIILLKKNFSLSAKESFKEAKPYIWSFLWLSILLTILIFAWGLLLIIPAIIFGLYYGFAQYILVAEDTRPVASIKRSYQLVKGYWWPVFGRFCLLMLIAGVIYIILWGPMEFMKEGGTTFNIYNVVVNLIWVLLSPFFTIYPYKVYEHLKSLKS